MSIRSTSAWKFATSGAPGNYATAPFFLWMALHGAKSALAFLHRAERDRPGCVNERTKAEAESLVRHIEALEQRSWRNCERHVEANAERPLA